MKKNIRINEKLELEELKKRGKTIINIYENNVKKVSVIEKTNDYFWVKYVYDENYIIIYSRGCMVNQIPLNIECVYDIKEKRNIDLSNKKLKVLFESMYITKRGFDLSNILDFINDEDLQIINEDEKSDLKIILTCGNIKITDDEVLKYIIEKYPLFNEYRNLKGPLSVIQYKKIEEQIGQDIFRFHLMPQKLNFIEESIINNLEDNRNFKDIYVTEYEHQQKILKLKNKTL